MRNGEDDWKEVRFMGRDLKEVTEKFHDWLAIAAAEEIEDSESIQVHQLHEPGLIGLIVRYKPAAKRQEL